MIGDMAVDTGGRVSWWLTWLEAAADVEAVDEAAVMSVGAEEYVPVAVYSRRAAEEYVEVGVLVEEAGSVSRGMQEGCKAGSVRGLERRSGCNSR